MMTEEDAKLFEKNHLAKTEAHKPFKATKQQIEEAIDSFNGMTYDICLHFDCTPKQLYTKIDKFGLRDSMQQARQALVAQAESVVGKALKSENEKLRVETARFILERLGREDGWGQNPQIVQQIDTTDGTIKQIFGI